MARRAWRYGLLGLGVVILLAVAPGAVLLAEFDPNSLKPRIEAAAQQVTGRELALNGPISVKFSLWPTIVLRDVSFANPPGFSRPQMATLDRLELQLAVLPLLHHQFEVARLVLVHPDILLEIDSQRHANWVLTPPPGNAQATGGNAATGAGTTTSGGAPATGSNPIISRASSGETSGTTVSLHELKIEDGTLTWRNDRTGKTEVLALTQFTAKSVAPDGPQTLAADATYNGVGFKLSGEVGPLARLQRPDAETPWPVKLTLAAAGATLSVDGVSTHPLQGRGYTLTLDATIPDLSAAAPLLPGTLLPSLHGVRIATRISDSGGRVPRVTEATLHLGAADLGAYVAGLRIVAVDIEAPNQDQPVKITAEVSLADTPVRLAATVGLPGALMADHPTGSPAAVPVDIILKAANASMTIKGTIAHPETLSGADLALDANIPDLNMLSALAHRRLPAVTQIAFRGHLTDATGGFRHGAELHDVKLTSAAGDLSGDIGVEAGPPRTLTGKLHADRIDADALLAAARKPVTNSVQAISTAPPSPGAEQPSPGAEPPTPNETPSTTSAAPPTASAPPPVPSAAPSPTSAPPPAARAGTSPPEAGAGNARPTASSPAPKRAGVRLLPDTPIPFGLLRQANADLAVSVGDLTSGGADYRSIDLHVVLQDGKLRLAPFSADLPEGRLDASLSVDATAPAAPVAMTLHAPGLEVAPLLAAAGLPAYASGKLEIYADLHGTGDTPHAIAAGLDGSLGLAMQNGKIDTKLLEHLLGRVLERANLLGLLSRSGTSDLRCFALRADAQHGVAEFRALDLDSSVLTMHGAGSVSLGDETLALHLRPEGRVAGAGIVVPLRVTGPIRSPDVAIDAFGAAESNAGTVAGAVIGSATPLGLLGGVLGGGKLRSSEGRDTCAAPLALARGQAAPATQGGAASNPAIEPKPTGSGALLHGLFR